MLRIASHLEYLLRQHDCVVVPRLGGFVLQAVPASYIKEEHKFLPCLTEVAFNAKLQHNDGLLCERYMHAYGVGYAQAQRMLSDDVTELMVLLRKGQKISLGAVGTLRVNAEGQTVFATGDSLSFSVDSYGLKPYSLETWMHLYKEHAALEATAERKNIFYLPSTRRALRGISVAAAAIALFFIVSTPVENVSRSAYTASFVPTSVTAMPRQTSTDDNSKTVTLSKATVAPVINRTVEQPKKVTAKPAPKVKKTKYYVIIGSFASLAQAQQFMSYNVNLGDMRNANILTKDGKVRVYADVSENKAQATAYMAKVRQKAQFYDAWMLTVQ